MTLVRKVHSSYQERQYLCSCLRVCLSVCVWFIYVRAPGFVCVYVCACPPCTRSSSTSLQLSPTLLWLTSPTRLHTPHGPPRAPLEWQLPRAVPIGQNPRNSTRSTGSGQFSERLLVTRLIYIVIPTWSGGCDWTRVVLWARLQFRLAGERETAWESCHWGKAELDGGPLLPLWELLLSSNVFLFCVFFLKSTKYIFFGSRFAIQNRQGSKYFCCYWFN